MFAAGLGTRAGFSTVERFVRDAELIELDHNPADPPGSLATIVEVDGLPSARLIADLSVARMVVPTGGGSSVELRAADPALVLEAAGGLELEPARCRAGEAVVTDLGYPA